MADHREPHTIILDPAAPPLVALLSGNSMKQLETDVLPEYLMERRWYRAKNAGIANVRIADFILLGGDDAILLLDVTPAGRSAARYLLAATILWDEAGASASAVFAELRHGSAHGVLVEAFSDDRFIRQLIARIVERRWKSKPAHVGPDLSSVRRAQRHAA